MGGGKVRVAGEDHDPFDIVLNTAIAVGGEAVRFGARLHGMCEDFAWIDPEDFLWAAKLIEDARKANIYRAGMGWDGLAEFLRKLHRDDVGDPVVTSFSVSESFPNVGLANWEAPRLYREDGRETDQYDHDAWYELSEKDRWDLCVVGMQAREHSRQLSPGTMNVGFMSGHTFFDLKAEVWTKIRERNGF
jgi:hypothetical protein